MYCESCAPNQTLSKRLDNAPKSRRLMDVSGPSLVEFMAVGLSMAETPVDAARRAGLSVTDEEAERLAKEARERFPELVELQSSAVGKIIRQALTLVALRSRDLAAGADVRNASQLVRTMAQAMDLVQGGANAQYHPIQLIVQGPKDASGDPKLYALEPVVDGSGD